MVKISVDAGHLDFGLYIPNAAKRAAIRVSKEMNYSWNKWQLAMFIISSIRLSLKEEALRDGKGDVVVLDMKSSMAVDQLYNEALIKLNERNLDHSCVVHENL